MRIIIQTLVFFISFSADAQIANHVVISEVYGGGGNAGSVWRNDFIELYNPTSCPVALSGWSVQYASATGTSWQVTALSGTIPAKGFYLVQQAQGAGGTVNLPVPDATGAIAMSATAGKVALLNNATALSGACPTGGQIIDFVGYGPTAGCFEGPSPAPAPGNTTSIERKASIASTSASLAVGGGEETAGNGYDANSNSADFVVQSLSFINPQNVASIEGTAGNVVSVSAGAAPAEPVTNGTFLISLSIPPPPGGTVVTYALSGAATSGSDYTNVQAGSLTIPQGTSSATVNINVIDDLLPEGNEDIIITLLSATNGYSVCGTNATLILTDNDVTTTPISIIQGSGSSASAGSFTVEAIVTGIYPLLSPAGFYVQEEDADADASAATSEGIFVVSNAAVALGDKVRIVGTVQENASTPSFDQAVFNTAAVTVLTTGNPLPTVADIILPMTAVSDFERYEGMLVRFPGLLTVTNNFTLGRYGEVGLSSGGSVYQPTQLVDPNDNPPGGSSSAGSSNVAAVNSLGLSNALRTILLDDGRNTIPTLPYVDPVDSTLRLGSTINNLTGIMGYAFNFYRIQPVTTAPPSFIYAARPAAVPGVGNPDIRIASFNVLNYFNGNGTGGGFPTSRGAHSLAEFNRQRNKIINALVQINADIVGLIELENDGVGSTSAIQDLVNGLNAVLGTGTYSIINDGTSIQTFGTDEIRCGIIYKSSVVTPTGLAMLGSDPVFNRPPLAHAFSLIATGVSFNFIVNHFKSKSCSGSTGADIDQLDGQACFNDRRKLQSNALLSFINTTVIPLSATSRVLSVGDYNAYYEEDPLDILRAANYSVLGTSSSYSYQFDGQIGSLDHAVVSSSLAPFITGIAKWNINAAEPVHLDYNDAINDGGSDFANPWAGTYTVSPFRSSDHDPVIIGLNLPSTLPVTLLDFNASKVNNMANLDWDAVQEVNIANYIAEHSPDGVHWKRIGAVVPRKQTQSAANSYSITHASPVSGDNYYRLKIEGRDGDIQFSPVRLLTFNQEIALSIFPNPAGSTLNLDFRNTMHSSADIEIVNTMNQVLTSSHTDSGGRFLQIDLSGISSGVYTLRVAFGNGDLETIKFVKQ